MNRGFAWMVGLHVATMLAMLGAFLGSLSR
jgi:hypothetical protein